MLLLNDAQRRWLGLVALWLCALLTDCADPRARFEDFQDRSSETDAGPTASDSGILDETHDGGPCTPPAPGTVSGPTLLAIETSLAAGRPILFLGTIDTPEQAGTTAVYFVYRALDSEDRRTRVGDELEVGPYPLHEGKLVALVPESELAGAANPVLHGASITSEMTLTGHIASGDAFIAGLCAGRARDYSRVPSPDASASHF